MVVSLKKRTDKGEDVRALASLGQIFYTQKGRPDGDVEAANQIYVPYFVL